MGLAFCLHSFKIIFFGRGYFFRCNIYKSICYQSPFGCTDEELAGFYLGFFVWGEGGKSILKKMFEPRGTRKKFFRPSRRVRGHAPSENFENIVFRIG